MRKNELELLKDQIELNINLIDFIEEVFKNQFHSDSGWLFCEFLENVSNGIHYNGCLSSYKSYVERYEGPKKRSTQSPD